MDLEILHDYLIESRELLQKAQEDTLRLESAPEDREALASIFRAFHTIKGGAAFLEAEHLVGWAHDLEDLLDKLRSHSLPVIPARIDAILGGIDVIESMLDELAKEQAPNPGPAEMSRRIRILAGGSSGAETTNAGQESEPVPVLAGGPDEPHNTSGATVMLNGAETAPALAPQRTYTAEPLVEEERDIEAEGAAETALPESNPWSPAQGAAAPRPQSRSTEIAEKMLRVDATRLDAVMNQVGELVLLRNRLTSSLGSLRKEDENMMRIAREMDLRVRPEFSMI